MKLSDKICPFCGKIIVLITPSKEYLPEIIGRCTGGSGFLMLPSPRIRSYTRSPQAKYHDLIYSKRLYETQADLTAFKFGHPSNELGRFERTDYITVNKIRKHLNRGGIHLYQKNLLFLCKNCRHPVAFNENPRRAKWIFEHLWFYLAVFYLIAIPVQYIMGGINLVMMLSLLGSCILATACYAAFVFGKIRWLESNRNNLAPLDDYASLARLPRLITVSRGSIPNKYCCESNIFSMEINREKYQLYITHADSSTLDLYICGINGEQKKLLDILNQGTNISLCYKGKSLGDTTVLDTFILPDDFYADDATEDVSDDWYCDSCGYTNHSSASECRSCGKYK